MWQGAFPKKSMEQHLLEGPSSGMKTLLAAEAAELGYHHNILVLKELFPSCLYHQGTDDKRTAVHGAAINARNNGAAAMPVLEAVAGPDHKCYSHRDADGNTPLMLACQGYDGPPNEWPVVAEKLMPSQLFRRPNLLEIVNDEGESMFDLVVKRDFMQEWLQGVAAACGAKRPVQKVLQLDLTAAELEQPLQQRFSGLHACVFALA